MAFDNPSVADFKVQMGRAFPFGTDPANNVLDADITSAFVCTNININQGLFADQGSYSYCYNLLSAHYLVLNMRASSQGLNGQYSWLEQSKGVGGVSVSYSIPPMVTDNPLFSMLSKTNFGAQYLGLIYSQLSGQMFTVCGTTRA